MARKLKILKKCKGLFSGILATTIALGALTSCGGTGGKTSGGTTTSETTTKEQVKLKVLMTGDKPNDWDKVLEEFYARTDDTLNIRFDWTWVPSSDYKDKLNVKMTAGEEYDLVFDAPWMHLRTLTEDGAYADLAPYLNNDEYPGLKAAFPETVMQFNKFSGINSALPLFYSYQAVNIVLYRMDWAKEFGIGVNGQIQSDEEFEQYLDAVMANKDGVTPIALKSNRGFFHLFDKSAIELGKDNIMIGNLGKDLQFAMKLNDDKTQVIATALPGDADEYWDAIGTDDFFIERAESHREWNKYTETDSLTQEDPQSQFYIGKASAAIDFLDAVPKFYNNLTSSVSGAELGVFIHDEEARAMETDVYKATLTASNMLAVPASSENIDRTMEFLDWLFANQENHDLFEYGIEGLHWEAIGDNQYKLPDGMQATANYNPNGWNLTWNPLYYRFSQVYDDYTLPYAEWSTELDNFVVSAQGNFSFRSEPVKTEVAQCGAILGEVRNPIEHGILEDPTKVLKDTAEQLRKNNIQVAIDEYVKQYNEYLSENK